MFAISKMSANLATQGLLEIKTFQNKYYDVIVSIHDVTNQILLRDSKYIVGKAM